MKRPFPSSQPQEQLPETLAAYCKALAHPVRVQILKILLDRGECISGDINMGVEKAASTVSEHLRILKESGLVAGTIDGTRRCYCANHQALAHLQSLIALLGSRNSACCRPFHAPVPKTQGDADERLGAVSHEESEAHHGCI